MPSQNFRVKNGLEVGTGVTISAGIITATTVSIGGSVTAASFYGDGSGLSGIAGAASTENIRTNSLVVSGVSTTSALNVGTGGTVITTTGIGSVGIGTINPIEKLTVYGTGIVRTLVQNPGTTGNDFAVYDWKAGSANHWSAYTNASTNYFRIFDNSKGANGLRFIIDDDGDVGLGGTVTPSAKLDVTGNAAISSNLNVSGIITSSAGTLGSNGNGTRTVSTSDPTGGSNGDVWYKV